ncbi:hypothetical protein G6F62_014557 [Rhizopus arrhizus]|nr:hypothetical protein G6F62_014557 [Rhizopus arrhizus]
MMAGILPRPNSITTGIRYTKLGMVCITSSTGSMMERSQFTRAISTPSGMPMTTAMALATPTISRVSSSDVISRSISCGLMSYFFNGDVTGGQRGNRVLDRGGRALGQHEHRAHGHALDVFDAGLNDPDASVPVNDRRSRRTA